MNTNTWLELKTTVRAALPWMLVIVGAWVFIHSQTQTATLLTETNSALATAVREQGQALNGVKQLLTTQGYVVPPTVGSPLSK